MKINQKNYDSFFFALATGTGLNATLRLAYFARHEKPPLAGTLQQTKLVQAYVLVMAGYHRCFSSTFRSAEEEGEGGGEELQLLGRF